MFSCNKKVNSLENFIREVDGVGNYECGCSSYISSVYFNNAECVRHKLHCLAFIDRLSLVASWCEYNYQTYDVDHVEQLLDLFLAGAPLTRLVSSLYCFLIVCDDCASWDMSTMSFVANKYEFSDEDRRVALLLRFRACIDNEDPDVSSTEESLDLLDVPVSFRVVRGLYDSAAIRDALDQVLTYCMKNIREEELFTDSVTCFQEVGGYPLLFLVLSKQHFLAVLVSLIVEDQFNDCFVSFLDLFPINDAFIIVDGVVRAPMFKGLDGDYHQIKNFFPKIVTLLNSVFMDSVAYMNTLFAGSYWKVCPITEMFKNKLKARISSVLSSTRAPIVMSRSSFEYSIMDKGMYSLGGLKIMAHLVEVYQVSHSTFFEVTNNGEYLHLYANHGSEVFKDSHGIIHLPFSETVLLIPNYIWHRSKYYNDGDLPSHLGWVSQ